VSKVSIKPREPVLESNDPLSRAMQDKIQDSKGENELDTKTDAPLNQSVGSVMPNPEHTRKSSKQHHGFAPLPEEGQDDAIALEEGIPISVVSAPTQKGPVVLPPPPPLDSLETYSLGTNDFKYNPHPQSSCRNWRLIICVASILLLGVIAGAVATVVVVLNKDDKQSASANEGAASQSPTPTTPKPTTSNLPPTTPPTEYAPIAAPVSTPSDAPILDRLIDLFSNYDQATASALLDEASPQYQAMLWLERDAQQNDFTLSNSENRISQRGALAIFYYSTGGKSQWASNTSWLDSSLSECEWYGVTCAEGSTTVQSIFLAENNVGGALPVEVGLLSGLTSLTLYGNIIGSTIPNQVGQLTLLNGIAFNSNELTGSIPDTISQLSNLESLELGGNSLDGNIPDGFSSLSLLKSLRLENNNLVGSIPPSITSASSLTILSLNGNELTGLLPAGIGLMSRLNEIYLYSNQLAGPLLSELGNLVDCNFMMFADNTFAGTIPETLGNAEKLAGLSLSNNALTGTIPSSLGGLSDLSFLRLDGNYLTGVMPPEVCALGLPVDVQDSIIADCNSVEPEVECSCCSNCPPVWN
jgi:Leucine-rich repeat (LRR) protein